MDNRLKTSRIAWAWYRVALMSVVTLAFDAWAYGFAGPFLVSAPDWLLVGAGITLCIPLGGAINLFAVLVVIKKVKSITGSPAESKEH